ncbi:hypothetical protein KCP74_04450 [Salmonella enterica subsp. enterica]|nr:hypothetical protein KCP74_04450 [Salmonella enterica subsp. enterica]
MTEKFQPAILAGGLKSHAGVMLLFRALRDYFAACLVCTDNLRRRRNQNVSALKW